MRTRLFFSCLAALVLATALGCGDDDGPATPADTGPAQDGSIGLDSTTPTPPTPPPTDGGTPGDGSTPPLDGGDAMTPPAGMSRIERSCAPNDGPALTLTVARGGPRCEPDLTNEHLVITVYGELPIEAPETITFGASSGFAQRCIDGDAMSCELAESGSVTFDTFTDGGPATGTFVLEVGGERLEGFFSAVFCGDPPLCG